jgi:tRNA(Ile2) C34 agmatinyltransferase TiaS
MEIYGSPTFAILVFLLVAVVLYGLQKRLQSKKCPTCGGRLKSIAPKCPYCGHDFPQKEKWSKPFYEP